MKGRIAGVGATAMVLAAIVAALGAPAASAACPNEAFRTGPSAFLAECRAYEMVTPVDKESGVALQEYEDAAVVAPSGDEIFFYGPSAYAGQQGSVPGSPYLAARASDTWNFTPVGAAQAPQNSVTFRSVLGVRGDLALTLITSKEALAPGATPFGSNLYIRDNRTGSYTTVVGFPGNEAFGEWQETFGNPFVDADADWGDILLASRTVPLTADAAEGVPNLYEYREGELRLAVAGAERATINSAIPNVMSADGSRFYYKEGGAIYLHQRGQEVSEQVSEDGNGAPFPAQFLGATPDGEVAFLFQEGGSIYRFEASAPAGRRLTNLAPSPQGGGSPVVVKAYAGEDGTTVYFAARSLLTPDAEPFGEGIDFYAWHGEPGEEGALRYLGRSQEVREVGGPPGGIASPDGRLLALESFGQVTPDAVGSQANCPEDPNVGNEAGRCLNVFLYSYDANRLDCITCSASPPAGNSRLAGQASRMPPLPGTGPLLNDGSVLFETPDALAARDTDEVGDVYLRRDGATQLISTGTAVAPSTAVGISADGSDVFLQTSQPLVGQDIDRIADLYDARVGGGLPQGAAAKTTSCIVGVDCRGGTAPTPPSADTGSATFDGGGNVVGACAELQSKARSARKRSHALGRRARRAKDERARRLRKKASREAKAAARLGRRAGSCTGGGR